VDQRRRWIRLEKVRSGSEGRKAQDQLTLNRPGLILGKIHGTPPPNVILLGPESGEILHSQASLERWGGISISGEGIILFPRLASLNERQPTTKPQ